MPTVLSLVATGGSLLAPADAAAAEYVGRLPENTYLHCEVSRPRNPGHHRKFFALMHVAFDLWSGTVEPQVYRGEQVLPNIDRFRKDVAILAGYGRPVVNVKGEVRVEAQSISFASMDQVEFDAFYNRILDVLMHKVLRGIDCDRADLEHAVAELEGFA